MQFRCPNCQHAIKIEDSGFTHEDETVSGIECPSCHSHFNLSSDEETTVAADKGAKIGHFVIQTVLGEGSFGTVYKAYDSELNRSVAIKIPRAGRVSSKTSKLFLREAQSAARVKHPNVVSVFEVGRHQDQYYIASEFIEGISLADYLKNRSLNQKDAVRLLIKVLRGVDSFHKEGIIHRDLKPANILLDNDREPHITDFGLARHESENAITVTQDGDIFGTPVYMPPEQARGDVHQIDHRSDIYAVGVILYQLLTGEKPFKASSSRTLLYSIQNDDPKRPRAVDKRIPRDLEVICQKAIEKDSALRYQTASAMADDLQRWLDGHPILARPASRWRKISKWIIRHKALAAALAVAICSLIFAAFMLSNQGLVVPDNMTPVMVETNPPADWIRLIKYNEVSRLPDKSGFETSGKSAEQINAEPGFYRLIAGTDDGAFHEVWRTVPVYSNSDVGKKTGIAVADYPHRQHMKRSDGMVQLPGFQLFKQREIKTPMALQEGGAFTMGIDEQAGRLAAKHQQNAKEFYVALRETSYGEFRSVLAKHHPAFEPESNWLSFVYTKFGNRDEIDSNVPVTDYPRDVAILYCELVGGRLPTHIEYEWLATNGGTTKYPSGNQPAIQATDWNVLSNSQPTADVTKQGVQNIYGSVAEYTDSSTLNYAMLYPEEFPGDRLGNIQQIDLNSPVMAILKTIAEARGAPKSWMLNAMTSDVGSPHYRIPVPQDILYQSPEGAVFKDQQTAPAAAKREILKRTGWRPYRSSFEDLR